MPSTLLLLLLPECCQLLASIAAHLAGKYALQVHRQDYFMRRDVSHGDQAAPILLVPSYRHRQLALRCQPLSCRPLQARHVSGGGGGAAVAARPAAAAGGGKQHERPAASLNDGAIAFQLTCVAPRSPGSTHGYALAAQAPLSRGTWQGPLLCCAWEAALGAARLGSMTTRELLQHASWGDVLLVRCSRQAAGVAAALRSCRIALLRRSGQAAAPQSRLYDCLTLGSKQIHPSHPTRRDATPHYNDLNE